MQMAELQMWPVLRDLDARTLRDTCLHLFKREWLDSGQVLFSYGSAIPQDPATCKFYLLVQGSAMAGVPGVGERGPADGKGHDEASLASLVVMDTIYAKRKDMMIMLGLEALAVTFYPSTIVCKCAHMYPLEQQYCELAPAFTAPRLVLFLLRRHKNNPLLELNCICGTWHRGCAILQAGVLVCCRAALHSDAAVLMQGGMHVVFCVLG
jgi:hypothetical protein